jgi:hypothetical protein
VRTRTPPRPRSKREAFDVLLDDEVTLEQAFEPLLALARRRQLSPAAAEATIGLLVAWERIRRQRLALEVEVSDADGH